MRKIIWNDNYGTQYVTFAGDHIELDDPIWDEAIHGPLSAENEAKVGGLSRDNNGDLQYDQTAFDAHHAALLEAAKAKKIEKIKAKTNTLLEGGFLYDGQYFKLDTVAVGFWVGINVNNLIGIEVFPRYIFDRDGNHYLLQSGSHWNEFWAAGTPALNTIMGSGNILELQVKAATTLAEVEGVIDVR